MNDWKARIYLATIADDAAETARRFGLGLEIDEFCTAANLDEDFPVWDARVCEQIEGVSRRLLHAPFAELAPCAIDPLVRKVARKRFDQAAEVCRRYGARGMIVHSGMIPNVYFPEWFVEQSACFFREFLSGQPEEFRLYIENVLDPDPAPLLDMVCAIDDERAQLCLDVGHAHVASKVPVRTWLKTLAPKLGHLHLHDNDASFDQHRLPGDGTIGFPALLSEIAAAAPEATATFECLDAEGCAQRLLKFGALRA